MAVEGAIDTAICAGQSVAVEIAAYDDRFRDEIIDLVLHVQNAEYGVGISIDEQEDILAIEASYLEPGGNFWVALNEDGAVVGCIGLQKKSDQVAVLKKFFVYADYRGKEHGVGSALYEALLRFARQQTLVTLLLDTPSVATRSHSFYRRVGFVEIESDDLPIKYEYPDRDSLLFALDLRHATG